MSKRTLFVGLDVHAESIAIAVLDGSGDVPRTSEIPNDPKVVRRSLQRLAQEGTLRCCYEAGSCGFELKRQLDGLQIPCEVIAPALIPRKPGERIKTDRRDAIKLARCLRSGDLTAIRVPTPDEEAVRDLVRAREDLRKDLVAARHRLSKFLLRHGRRFHAGAKWTEGFWRWVDIQVFERVAERLTFEHYVGQVRHLLARREELERAIEGVAAQDSYRHSVARLSCLRGISLLSAMGLLAEIQDFRRFASPRELMAFVGLVPSERSSGGKQQRGGITKTGNSHARRLFVEAAWAYRHLPCIGPRIRKALVGQPAHVDAIARKAQRRLHQRYRHLLARGKRAPVAVTAVARELCGFAWALMVAPAA